MQLSTFNFGAVGNLNGAHAIKHDIKEGYDLIDGKRVSNEDFRYKLMLENILSSGLDIFTIANINPIIAKKLKADLAEKNITLLDPAYCDADKNETKEEIIGTAIAFNSLFESKAPQNIKTPTKPGDWQRGAQITTVVHLTSQKVYDVVSFKLKGFNVQAEAGEAKEQEKNRGFRELEEILARLPQNSNGKLLGGGVQESPFMERGSPNSRFDLLEKNGFQMIAEKETLSNDFRDIIAAKSLEIIPMKEIAQDLRASNHKIFGVTVKV